MANHKTVYEMLVECAASLSGTFGRQEILSWFRRHYPDVPESTVGAHIQALTSNATNRERNHPCYGRDMPLFDRVSHGTYRLHQPGSVSTDRPTLTRHKSRTAAMTANLAGPESPRSEWNWEGTIQAAVVGYLVSQGVAITRVADTASKEHGTDVEGRVAGLRVHVEVKGWPSDRYIDPARAGEVKRTSPALQARVWFADGLMHVLRLRASHPDDRVLLALPDVGTYRRLVEGVQAPIDTLRIGLLWVDSSGVVTES